MTCSEIDLLWRDMKNFEDLKEDLICHNQLNNIECLNI